jgi:hypothetical protein
MIIKISFFFFHKAIRVANKQRVKDYAQRIYCQCVTSHHRTQMGFPIHVHVASRYTRKSGHGSLPEMYAVRLGFLH